MFSTVFTVLSQLEFLILPLSIAGGIGLVVSLILKPRATLKFCGSLKFAVVLLSVLIIAAIAGTIYETKFNADVAQKYIYGAAWFNLWLTLLGINLFCAAAVRYPWKRHQTGFVITHAGIITLLVGAMIDRMYGVEGNVQLYSTRPATNILELHKQIFTVNFDGKKADTSLQTSTLWNEMPLNSPDPSMKVEIKDVEPVTTGEEAEAVPNGKPALAVTLQGSMMGRNDATLFMEQPLNLGPASLMFLPGRAKDPAAKSETPPEAELKLEFQGKTFSFPKLSKGTKELALEGLPDWKLSVLGFFPNFRMDENKQPTSVGDELLNPAVAFDLIGPAVKGANLDKPEGPHSGAPIKQDLEKVAPRQERFFVFAKGNQVMNSVHHGEPTGAKPSLLISGMDDADPLERPNGVIFYLDPANQEITYLLKSRRSGAKIGKVELEKPVNVDWAPGAQFVVHEFIPSARAKLVFVPRPELKKGDMESSGNQGVKVVVTVGNETKSMWVGQTPYDNRIPQDLTIAGKKVAFEFVNEVQKLPFSVGLKKFKAKLREGETAPDPNDPNPSELSFSSFESVLSFEGREDTVWLKSGSDTAKQFGATVLNGAILSTGADDLHFQLNGGEEITLKNSDIERTEKLTQDIAMNFPTTFPVSLTGPFTGRCYKFSQAGHNAPRDWTYSGVQVLYAPGWLYEWLGCLGIIFGIFTMFYLRPYFNRSPAKAVAAVPPPTKKKVIEKQKKLATVES